MSEGDGDELRTFEEVGVAEKDCSNGFNSRSKFDRVWRVCGAGDRDWLLRDMRDVTKMTNADVASYIHYLVLFSLTLLRHSLGSQMTRAKILQIHHQVLSMPLEMLLLHGLLPCQADQEG